MSDNTLSRIISHLQEVERLRAEAEQSNMLGAIVTLQEWQCQRLLASHDDLWQQKRFKPAIQFFIDELYGPKDFSQRDQDIARVAPKMAKLLPEKALDSLESALHLNALSFGLDFALASQLQEDAKSLNRNTYAQAYKACNNRAERDLQFNYIRLLGQELADVVKIKGISTLLLLSRKSAKIAGVASLHKFIETGFKAFKKIGRVEDFLDPVISREQALMEALFSADSSSPEVNPLPEGI